VDCLDEVAEGSVAREQNHLVDLIGEAMASTASSMSMFPFTLRRPLASVNLHSLGDYSVAIVAQPICERANRGVFLISIIDGSRMRAARNRVFKFLEEALEVDVEAERPRGASG